jgi:alkanesulfonate monooxygenase SsuD/methylene tetrahydromethanopterin reductase-like flavin-dependent oxidoreductase (luciferase family)
VDEDFNRLWGPGVLADPKRIITSEVRRARAIQPFLATVDLLLDIHSMQQPCVPLMMAGMVAKGRDLAAQVGIPSAVITDSGHTEGMRMRDYAAFRDPNSARNALLIECGQHWERAAADVAKATMVRFLRASKVVENDFAHDLLKTMPAAPAQAFYEVGEIVTVESDAFIFDQPWEGFEHLAKDTLIGRDGSRLITAPFDTTVLIMPSKRLHPGKTAVRLAHPISQ